MAIIWFDKLSDLDAVEDILFDSATYLEKHTDPWGDTEGAVGVVQALSAKCIPLPVGSGIVEGGFACYLQKYACNHVSEGGIGLLDGNGNVHFHVVDQYGTFRVWNDAGSSGEYDSAQRFTPPSDIWWHCEVQFKIDATTGYVKVWMNEVEVYNKTSIDTEYSAGDTEVCGFRIVAQNCTGQRNRICMPVLYSGTTRIGIHRVRDQVADAAGTNSDFAPLASTNISQVDETKPDKDTSYNSSSTSAHIDDFNVGAYDGSSAAVILAVAASVTAKQESVGSTQLKVGVITEGANTSESTFDVPSTGYRRLTHVVEVNPDDSNAFEDTDLDGIKVKYEIV